MLACGDGRHEQNLNMTGQHIVQRLPGAILVIDRLMVEILSLDGRGAQRRSIDDGVADEGAQRDAGAAVGTPARWHHVEGKLVRGDHRDAAEAVAGCCRKAVAGIVAVAELDPAADRVTVTLQ